MTYDIYSNGNALVDLIVESNEDFLKKHSMNKGGIIFLKEKEAKEIIDEVLKQNPPIIPGGSAANVISTMAMLNSKTTYTGSIGQDYLGEEFEKEMNKQGTKTILTKSEKHTGTCVTVITPDKERSFAVYLGASQDLKNENISFEAIKESKIIHIEGYQFYDKKLRPIVMKIVKQAKEDEKIITFDLSSHNLVKEYKEETKEFLEEYVDILFTNEEESASFTDMQPDEAIEELSKLAKTVILKLGEKGSLIKTEGEFYEIPPVKTEVVDTNGAGDAYAAGFLHGYINSMPILECGRLASMLASKVVSQVGAKIRESDLKEIIKTIKILN